MRAQQQVIARQQREKTCEPAAVAEGLPHGLTIKTLGDYKVEWSRYLQFSMQRRQPYEQIKLNEKTVEARLFYPSYKKYKVGHEIVFRRYKGSPNSVRRIITAIRDYGR